jgi:hypothetical protein
MKTLLKDSAIVLAVLVGLLYLLGYRRESAYLRCYDLSINQFAPAPAVTLLTGFNVLSSYPSDSWWNRIACRLGAILFVGYLVALHMSGDESSTPHGDVEVNPKSSSKSKIWIHFRKFSVNLGHLVFNIVVFSLFVLACEESTRFATKCGKNDAVNNRLRISIMVDAADGSSADTIAGTFVTKVDGVYAVRVEKSPQPITIQVRSENVRKIEIWSISAAP